MSTIVRRRTDSKLPDGVYRAVVADVEPGIPSRFTTREDLVRVSLDVTETIDGQRPRLWLVSAPILCGRLQALVEAALHRTLTDDEAETFDLDEVIGKEVNVVLAQVTGSGGFTSSRIVTFLPVSDAKRDDEAD
jgi:hypothetical protein